MKTILFQGDSITDCYRDRNDDENLGNGYPRLLEADLGFRFPGQYRFFNRGNSGNRIPDLYARIVQDMINLQPDYLSILIGINDVWRGIDSNYATGGKRFEKLYHLLAEDLRESLPDCKLMLLEPFVLEGTATVDREDRPDSLQRFRTEVAELSQITRSVAEAHGAVFVPLQQAFNDALEFAPADYWLIDGVHPTATGHALIAREWLKAFRTLD